MFKGRILLTKFDEIGLHLRTRHTCSHTSICQPEHGLVGLTETILKKFPYEDQTNTEQPRNTCGAATPSTPLSPLGRHTQRDVAFVGAPANQSSTPPLKLFDRQYMCINSTFLLCMGESAIAVIG